jgi:hypothetical protein
MSKITKDQLSNILVDVRKAYRLLYSYQRRVMDTVQFIGAQLSKHEPNGYPLFSSMAPGEGRKVNFDNWAWDWMPMYCYEFYFGKEEKNGNAYEFAISIYSDSGYDDSEGDHDQTQVEKFVSPEQSTTKIYLYIGKNMWKPEEFDNDWTIDSKDEVQYGDANGKFISKRFDLTELMDEESIISCLAQFKSFCEVQGMGEALA